MRKMRAEFFKTLKKDNLFDKCDFEKLVVIFFQQNYYELKDLNLLCNDTKEQQILL